MTKLSWDLSPNHVVKGSVITVRFWQFWPMRFWSSRASQHDVLFLCEAQNEVPRLLKVFSEPLITDDAEVGLLVFTAWSLGCPTRFPRCSVHLPPIIPSSNDSLIFYFYGPNFWSKAVNKSQQKEQKLCTIMIEHRKGVRDDVCVWVVLVLSVSFVPPSEIVPSFWCAWPLLVVVVRSSSGSCHYLVTSTTR